MKFSLSKNTRSNKSLNVTISSKEIEKRVSSKLQVSQKTAKVKGFRKGKVPLDIISKMYEPQIRQDVLYEEAAQSFYKQVEKKGLKPVGKPSLLPQRVEPGKDVLFKVEFEVYPEVNVKSLHKLSYKKFLSSLEDRDLNETITNMRKRFSKWEIIKETASLGDRVKIDFKGTIGEEDFEGNTANDFLVEIGSKSMIKGFEEGLLGVKAGDKKILNLNFPKDYQKKELASKEVQFDITVKEVLKPNLVELNEDFFKQTGIEVKSLNDFRKEVRKRLEDDLNNLLKNKIKQNILDSLALENPFDLPKVMIDTQINSLRLDAAKRMGIDPKDANEEKFPSNSFQEEAEKRVRIGVLLNKIIEDRHIKPSSDRVKEIIKERASLYKDPEQVINWFYSNDEQLRNIEAISLEEQVVDLVMHEAQTIEEKLSYEECINGN